MASHNSDTRNHEPSSTEGHIANTPLPIDPWAKDYTYFMAPQEEVDYIRSISTYEDFQRELQQKTEASGDAKKIRKIIATLDGPLGKYRSLSEAVRAASHGSQPAQSAIWGGMLVVLTWSFRKIDYLKLIVDMLARMADPLPQFDGSLDVLARQAAPSEIKEARALKEIQEPVRIIYLQVTEFTHSTAMTLWMKLGFSQSLPVGGVTRRLMQAATMPFFKKTLAEDFERNLSRVQREALQFNAAAQKQ